MHSLQLFLNLIYSEFCGIQHGEHLIVTGAGFIARKGVYKVNITDANVTFTNLPRLNEGRFHHGCTSYASGDNIMVTRGINYFKILVHFL